ncbi:polyphosphate--glucose phosphotransferase [Jonesia denitrificans]|uniref:ROK family protein n=1 Tax=Jonesia denitrificans (strain ATCC 14870 / DSM 20603 / BCRC 15368 / CIP 55.134 / JCM 11481 / NBRC 15587 / NCTC 10816 / Prevot 55134) TaxID=471856 RepID=C7R4X1_JONDD|nr:ROK family protein [Jonesia denitrificans]ACV09141.1 ROK family protein [Jonesia denitrificans DSM 20603]ASE09578.1 ROK family protein [Jonesia denitrificans]QXB44120.1 ROK family protein [Jonesia denitrificans]SQH21359.1 Polyphosphate glucokinase [Jonesia denitrificans]
MSKPTVGFGIDIGGSGIKGAPVDLTTGEFLADRVRIPTPDASTPQAVAAIVGELCSEFTIDDSTPIGVAFPGPIDHGVVRMAANLDDSWVGVNIEQQLSDVLGRRVHAVNDADAAGFGEATFGAARDETGVIFLATLGTGIGSALIVEGHLVPNTEFGHLEIDGFDAESRAADSARSREDLDWEQWATRLQRYFSHVELLLSPDLFVVGGGVSKRHEEFLPLLSLRAPIIPAQLLNAAGIAGAAAFAADRLRYERKTAKRSKKAHKKEKKG